VFLSEEVKKVVFTTGRVVRFLDKECSVRQCLLNARIGAAHFYEFEVKRKRFRLRLCDSIPRSNC